MKRMIGLQYHHASQRRSRVTGLCTLLLSALMGSVTTLSVMAEEAPQEIQQEPYKSTLETISLKSLESEDLAEAGIAGSLEAAAAGESIEVPDLLKERTDDSGPQDNLDDLSRFNLPVQYNLRADPLSVGGRVYNNDYTWRTTER